MVSLGPSRVFEEIPVTRKKVLTFIVKGKIILGVRKETRNLYDFWWVRQTYGVYTKILRVYFVI